MRRVLPLERHFGESIKLYGQTRRRPGLVVTNIVPTLENKDVRRYSKTHSDLIRAVFNASTA